MNPIFTLLLFICIFIVNPAHSQPQWSQSTQPTGGNCFTVHRVGNSIWAGYPYGIWVSTTDGFTWSRHPTLHMPVMDIQTQDNKVVVLYQENPSVGVYHMSTMTSFDYGNSFGNPVIVETGNSYYMYGDHSVWITDSSWVIYNNAMQPYVSFDFGQTWDSLQTLPGLFDLTAYSNKYIIANKYSGNFSTYYTENGGASWVFLDSAHTSGHVIIEDSTFYFIDSHIDTTTHFFLSRTSDFGATFDTLGYGLLPGCNHIFKLNGKIYWTNYPYPQGPVTYESADGGDTWTLSNLVGNAIWADDENSVLTNNWEYLFKTFPDGLQRWVPSTNTIYHTETGILATTVDLLVENQGALFIAVGQKGYRSTTAGLTWDPLPSFVNPTNGFSFSGDTIYAVTQQTYPSANNFCFSFDNGLTWDSVNTSIQPHWQVASQVIPYSGKLYALKYDYISTSTDWGITWDSVSTQVDSNCFGSSFNPTQLIVHNDMLFAIDDSRVMMLDTITATWKVKNCFNAPGVTYDHLYSLGNELVLRASSTFRVSSDTGNTWTTPLRNGFPTGQRPSGLYKSNGAWFASGGSGQIYYSFDLGDNWIQLPTNPEMSVSGGSPIFTMLNGILYAGGNNVWWNDDTLNIISGTVFLDNNNNSVLDIGEPVLEDHLLYTSPNNIAFDTDSNGIYQFFSAASGDTLRPVLPSAYCESNPDWFTTTGQAASVDFGLYFYPGIQDMSIDITNRSVFRPGFDTYLDIDVTNFGTVPTPTVLEVILDTALVFQSATVTPAAINGDTIVFNISPLLLMEKQEISILTKTYFSTPLDTPIYCIATLTPIIGDTVPQNNISEINELTTGSYDPNDKQASYDPYFTPTQLMNGEEMIYTIRFQNTGALPAINIFIRDTLSDFIDLQSFRLISMSHEGYFEFTQNRTVTFYFDNINLPGASVDEPNSHGYVKYAVKFFPGLGYGTGIENTASIFFDFNPPITTNTVITVIADPPVNIGFPETSESSQVTIFPNPVRDQLNLRITNGPTNARYQLTVFNSTGKQIVQKYFTGAEYKLEISTYSNGIYTGILEDKNTKHRMIFRMEIAK